MHPIAAAASLTLHAAVLAWLVVALPDFGEELDAGAPVAIDVVMTEADTPPQIPAEAAPLPERAPTRTPEPSPPAATPTPEPAGTPPPPAADPATTAPAPAPPPSEAPAAAAEPEPAEPAPAETPPPPAQTAEPEPVREMAALEQPPRRRPAAPPPPAPEPEATAAPTPPPAEPDPEPDREVAATEEAAGTPQPDPDTRREASAEADPVDALLQSVEQLARRVEAEEPREGRGDADVESATGRLAELQAQRLGRLIYEQIVRCWNPPAGLDGLSEVGPVEIRAEFRQNGAVAAAMVENEARLATDRVFRSVAESARRAVFNCAPLENMPSEAYPQWRLVILEFRPDQIAAGG